MPCTALSSWEVTKPRYLLLQDKSSIILFTSPLVTFGAAPVAHTGKELYPLPFWPFQKVYLPVLTFRSLMLELCDFLADRRYDTDPSFRKFKRQLYHSSISAIFSSIKKYMKTPVVRRCPDGHFRRVIFDFGPFIGDYPEQVMLTVVVQGWCARYVSDLYVAIT